MPPEKDGQPSKAAFEYILLHLTEPKHLGHAKSNETFVNRTIRFDSNKPTISVGRSSKTISKKLLPAKENAYFDSAVVSREHAEISADLDKGALHVTDIGSMHGTTVNDRLIKPSTPTPMKTGDVIRFGVHVARGLDVFFPVECRVDIDMKPTKASYEAPDPIDLSDDESECSDSSALERSQPDSASSYGNGADANVTIGEGIASSKALSVNGHVHERDNAAGPEATMDELIGLAFGYEDSEGESENSDIDMEEDEEDDYGDDNEESSSIDEEAEVDFDDGAAFLSCELDNYGKQVLDIFEVLPESNDVAEEAQEHDNAASADNNSDVENEEPKKDDKNSEHDEIVEDKMPPVAQTTVQNTFASTAAAINISALLNPLPFPSPSVQEKVDATLPAIHPSPAVQTVPASKPATGSLIASVADETAAWSEQAAINEAMPGDDIFVDAVVDVAKSCSQDTTTSKKRKADDMLAQVVSVDGITLPTSSALTPAEKEAVTEDVPSAAKRPATAKAVSAAKAKRGSVLWTVAEKVGIAAFGGAVVLGSMIYTAPSF